MLLDWARICVSGEVVGISDLLSLVTVAQFRVYWKWFNLVISRFCD